MGFANWTFENGEELVDKSWTLTDVDDSPAIANERLELRQCLLLDWFVARKVQLEREKVVFVRLLHRDSFDGSDERNKSPTQLLGIRRIKLNLSRIAR